MTNRVTFLVDGFNLYHSLKQAERAMNGISTRWLDLQSLFQGYISIFGRGAVIEDIYYFSAMAKHMNHRKPGTTTKHANYIDILNATGVKEKMGRFKEKMIYCRGCNTSNQHFEEKETDVAISLKLLELFHLDKADTIVLVTGDTDLAPAVRTADNLFPTKEVMFAFPYLRQNRELEKMVTRSFTIKKEQYAKHQLPEVFVLPSGREIRKPETW
jgi:uncharacterized LabA/DUF88 family protein